MLIILLGRIPSKKNSRILVSRGKRPFSIPSNEYKAWHEEQSWVLKTCHVSEPFERVDATLTFWFPDHRRTDLTNKAESIMDLLVDNKILKDDNWECVPKITLIGGGVDKMNPRCLINLAPVDIST